MNANRFRKPLPGTSLDYIDTRAAVDAIAPGSYDKLSYTARVHAENIVRKAEPARINDYLKQLIERKRELDFPWFPARVVCHDILGQTALVDLAGLRDAIADQGGDPAQVNPVVPVQLIVDHSLAVECGGFDPNAFAKNRAVEDRRRVIGAQRERTIEAGDGLGVARQQERAARLAIDAVRGAGGKSIPRRLRAQVRAHEIDHGTAGDAAARVHGHARGLVDDDDPLVFEQDLQVVGQGLGSAAVPGEQAHPPLGVEHVGPGRVVHRVAALGLAGHLGIEHAEVLGHGLGLLGVAAQRHEARVEAAHVGLQQLGRVALGVDVVERRPPFLYRLFCVPFLPSASMRRHRQ